MSFLSKWFKLSQRGSKNKSSKKSTPRTSPISETDDDDNLFTDEENITISSSNFYTEFFKQQAQFNSSITDLPEPNPYLNSRQAYIQELRKSYEKEQQNTDLEHQTLSFNQNEEIRLIEENIKVCQNDLERLKNDLNEDEQKLYENVEKRFKKLHSNELNLQKIKNDIEIQLQTSSIRLVTEQMHLVHLDWLNEECDKKLKLQTDEFNVTLVSIENSHKQEIDKLTKEIDKLKQEIETQKDSFKLDLDIALRSIESDYLKRNQEAMIEKDNKINELQNEICKRLLSVTALNETRQSQVHEDSMIMLNNVTLDQSDSSLHEEQRISSQIVIKSSFTNNNSSTTGGDDDEIYRELRDTLKEKEVVIKELQDEIEEYKNDLDNLKSKIENGSIEIMNTSEKTYKEKYLCLKQDIENFTHPIINDIREQLEDEFVKECESIKNDYDAHIDLIKNKHEQEISALRKEYASLIEGEQELQMQEKAFKQHQDEINHLVEEHEKYKAILKEEMEKAIMTYKSELIEQERKHKLDIISLEEEFENILNNELNRMKNEFEKAHKNQGCEIKFRYVSEHRLTELDRSDTITTDYIADRDEENRFDLVKESIIDNIALKPNENRHLKSIEIKASGKTKDIVDKNNKMDFSADYCELVESDEETPVKSDQDETIETLNKRIEELQDKNAKLQEQLQNYYEKDDVYTASTRRQNEENENFIKLLQTDIQQLTQERNSLVQNNQNLMNILSKTMLSSTTIEEHINRRLAKMFSSSTNQSKSSSKQASRGESPKTSSNNLNDACGDNDSTAEDLSDEGLDISQRICDTLAANNIDVASDEVIIETNIRVQQSIDKLLNMFEDSNKQLAESYMLQSQLAEKLEEKQKELSDTQTRINHMEQDNEERLKELIDKLSNYEGLAVSYENDLENKKREIEQLEDRLEACTKELSSARSVIESEERELSSMEDMRKELVAQREIFANELQDSNIKELFRNNSYLLDEKQELEYKLNKTVDMSQKQIKDLETTIDSLNQQLKDVKDKHNLELEDLRSQMESMESQIKSEKTFIESQTIEREQERDEYEAKIKELKDYINMRDIQMADNEQAALNKIKENQRILQEKTDMLNQLRLFNEELERKLNERDTIIDNLNDQIKVLESQVGEKSKSSETYEKKLTQLSNEIDILMQTIKKSSETIENYKEKVTQYEENEQNLKKNIDNSDKEKEEIMLEKTELQVQLYNYMSKFSELQLKKEEIEFEFKTQLNSLEEKVKATNLALVDKELTIEKQREQIIQLKEDLQNKIDTDLHHQNEVLGALSEGINYQDEINRLSEENMLLIKKIEQTKSELDKSLELKNSINDITQQLIESKNEEIEDLQKQIDDLKQTNEREIKLKLEIDELQTEHESEIKKHRAQIEKLENEAKNFKDERETFLFEKQEFEANCESLKKIINDQEHQIEQEKQRLNTIEKNFSSIEENYNMVSQKLADKEAEIELLNEDIIKLNEKINKLKDLNSNMELENDAVVGQLRQEIVELNEKLNEQLNSEKLHELEKKLSSALEENDKYKIEIDTYVKEIKELNEMKKSQENGELTKVQEDLKQLKEELSVNDLKLRNLQSAYDILKHENDDIHKERNDAEENFNQFKEKVEKQVNEYQFQIKNLLDEKDESKKAFLLQIDNLSLQLQNIKDENQNLTNKQLQELERKYLDELKSLKEKMEIQFEVDILKLKEDHRLEIESLKAEYERTLTDRIAKIEHENERKIDEIRHQYEKELTELDRSTSPDSTISYDYGNKLREQVIRTQELDSKLLDTMKNKKLNRSSIDESQIPSKIQQIMEKLDSEGVLLLSLTELLQLRNHLNQKAQGSSKLLNSSFENEKDQLTKQIYQLRDLLAKVNETQIDASKDWRGDLVRAVANIFKLEQDASLAELRTFVSSSAYLDENKINFLENKINTQADLHSKSLQNLLAADRQSILNELKHFKEENHKLIDDLKRIQEEEKQFRRELQLMEYNKDAENIKANDLKQSLNAEKQKSLELMDKLNQERKKSNAMQEQLCDLKEEVARIKDHLAGETKNYKQICKEFEKEKALNDLLKKKCDELEGALKMLKANSGDSQQLKKLNAELEDRFVELQHYANDLEQNMIEEKSKNENLQKLLNEEKQKTAISDKRINNFNMKNKFDQIQSSLKRQEKDIEIARNILNNSNKSNSTFGDLERIRQALELLAYKHKNEVDNSDKRHGSHSQAVKASLDEILEELKSLQYKTYAISGASSPVSTSFNSNIHDKLVKQNQELSETIKKITQEKAMLKNSLTKLEDELLNLKKTVSKTDHSNSSLTDYDKEKFKKLYYKYLRAESFRKSLVYQKRFLLIMLSGYEDTEREILATLRLDPRLSNVLKANVPPSIMARSYNNNADYSMNLSRNSSFYSNKYITNKAKSHFRTGAICIIAIHRIKFLLKKHSSILNKVDSNRQF